MTTGKCFCNVFVIAKSDWNDLPLVEHAVRAIGSELTLFQSSIEDRRSLIAAAVEKFEQCECDWIIAAGGDGTVNLAVNVACRVDKPPLVLIPSGTGNDFVRNLTLADDCTLTPDSEFRDEFQYVDVLQLDESTCQTTNYAINMVTVGNGAAKSDEITTEAKSVWGRLVYLIQFWRTISSIQDFAVRITSNELPPVSLVVTDIFIANGCTCGGGYRVAPEAVTHDGRFELLAVQRGDAIQTAALVKQFFAGQHPQNELVFYRQLTKLSIECDQPFRLTLDGEHSVCDKLDVRLLPYHIPVLVCWPQRMNGMISAVRRIREGASEIVRMQDKHNLG